MAQSYVLWALLGMASYSVTTLLAKLAARAGLPGSVTVAIATSVVAVLCWLVIMLRGQTGLVLDALPRPSGAWALAAGLTLAVAVMSLFRALELGPASVVVPVYGMFIVGSFLLGVALLGEPITLPKAVGLAAALASILLITR